jgi:predicted ATPase
MSEATHSIKLAYGCVQDQTTGRVRLAIFAIRELIVVLITALVDALLEALATFATAFDVEHYLHAWSETVRQASQSADPAAWVEQQISLWPARALERTMACCGNAIQQAAQSTDHMWPVKEQ